MDSYAEQYNEWWNEMSEEERQASLKARHKLLQQTLLESDQEGIDINNELIDKMKNIISKRINKDDYTDKDEEIVALALSIIKGCEKSIKEYERDIYLLTRYPVGSQYRPNIALLKEVK